MIEEPPLLTIARVKRRPSAAQIAAFRDVPTSFVVDAMFGAGALAAAIKPVGPDVPQNAVGPALTVDCGAGDILALLGALGSVEAGDVVISTVAGHQGCAAAGDRVSGMMKNCGAAGFVTDGPMRDYSGIVDVGLPCWCTGLHPGSPFGTGPGRIGAPITIGGCHVTSGDLIVADAEGVAVVPFEAIDATIAMLDKVKELEHALDEELRQGLKIPPEIVELLDSDRVRALD